MWPYLIYWNGPPNIVFYDGKKIRTARHVKQIIWQETCKSLDFWDIHSRNRVGELCDFASNKAYFELKTFFQRLLENFLRVVWPCLIYWKGPPNIVFYDDKKIRTARHVKQIIWQEMCQSLDFWDIHSRNRVGELCGFALKMPVFKVKNVFKDS